MIPLVVVAVALAVGVRAGWIMRAENGRRARGPQTPLAPGAPPYDWSTEPDL